MVDPVLRSSLKNHPAPEKTRNRAPPDEPFAIREARGRGDQIQLRKHLKDAGSKEAISPPLLGGSSQLVSVVDILG